VTNKTEKLKKMEVWKRKCWVKMRKDDVKSMWIF